MSKWIKLDSSQLWLHWSRISPFGSPAVSHAQENKHVIFTGNAYSAEWPVEAAKRGLPNLNTTPKAVANWMLGHGG